MSVILKEDFGGFGAAMATAAYQSLDQTAIISQTRVKELLTKHGAAPSAGKAIPSAPGQPPGLRTGSLRRSIQIDRSGNKGTKPFVLMGTAHASTRPFIWINWSVHVPPWCVIPE